MNEEALNMSIRKFLKEVGVSSQREIEKSVREALARGDLADAASLEVQMTLTADGVDLSHAVNGRIQLA
jgi:hypothetical protein